jgi:hypothetical protein
VERGFVKKKRSDGNWGNCMLSIYDNGLLVCCDSDSGVTLRINLDTVVSISDCSNPGKFFPGAYPNFTFELKTRVCSYYFSCENEPDFQKYVSLLRDLSPLCN